MNIGVDLRGLNYNIITGVNTYTIHFLYCLSLIKASTPSLHICCIGVDERIMIQLQDEFPFVKGLFDEYVTIGDYIGFSHLKNNTTLTSILILLIMKFTKSLEFKLCKTFDLLFLPQPKPILKNSYTDIVTVFHDIFGVIDNSTMNLRQRVIENKFVYQMLVDNCFRIFVNSISTGNDLLSFLDANQKQVRLVYPALPIWNTFTQNTKNKANIALFRKHLPRKFILAVSGIEPRKNWINCLLAFKKCQEQDSLFDYYFIFAGRVVNREYYLKLLEIITKHQIKNVLFRVDITDSQKKVLYEKCDFVIYPSFYEGFGFPILESFEAKKPIITSNISSMPELARNGAIYVNPLNYHEISRAISILVHDRSFYKSLVSNISYQNQKYSWDELENALREIL